MPRIPDHLVDRLKRDIPIAGLVAKSGIELRRVGESLVGRCNRHDDTTPSLVLTESKNLFHCLGACQKGGSTIDWVMWQREIGFYQAARELCEEHFPDEARALFGRVGEISQRRRRDELVCPLPKDAGDGAALARDVIAYYHEKGKQSRELGEYLEKRALFSAELVETFRLGYADRTLGMTLAGSLRRKLQELGFFRDTGHEHFNGSLVVPILGEDGEVLGCYGRKVRDDLRPGTPLHLYLPGPRRGVLNPVAFKASGDVVLCEAPLDALTFWRWGIRNATTAWGVEGFSEDLFEAFVSHGTERVLIAFDRDEAGDRGAEKVARRLSAAGVACYRVLFPKGMDANDVAVKMHPADKTLGLFVRSAEWMCGGGGARTIALGPGPKAAEAAEATEGTGTAETATSATSATDATSAAEATAAASPALPAEAAKRERGPRPGAAEEGSSSSPQSSSPPSAQPTMPPPAPPASHKRPGLVSLAADVAHFAFEDRRYRAVGLAKCTSLGSLRVSLRAERDESLFLPPCPLTGWFQDTVDLSSHRPRQHFEKEAARELGVKEELLRHDLGRILRILEDVQEERLLSLLAPKAERYPMTEPQRLAGLALGQEKDLVGTLLTHYDRIGVVGEAVNKLALYLAVVSRKLERPLAVVIRSSSAAGKTALMDAVLSFVPEEEREKYSALTENSLFYFEGKDFKHKVLALVEEEGAQRAAYALKLLQSEGEITIASTGKDSATGKLVTKEYRVEGPVMILLTSTAIEIDEELLNRCLVLTVDEGREQTKAIHRIQREAHTLDGLRARDERKRILDAHRSFQRLLRPLFVHNPYARELTFLDEKTRARRDHTKYLALIDSIALLHQLQRPVLTLELPGETIEYVEATLDDIALANGIAAEILGRSLDELPPQTRRLLVLLDGMVTTACERNGIERSDYRFSRRDVRLATGWGDTQLKIHLSRLAELEYLLVHRGGRGQSFVFELLYAGEGKDGSRFVLGLIDTEELGRTGTTTRQTGYDSDRSGFSEDRSGQDGERSGSGRASVGPRSGGGRSEEIGSRPALHAASLDPSPEAPETALIPPPAKSPSYPGRRRRVSTSPTSPRLNLLRFPPRMAAPVSGEGLSSAAAVGLSS